MLLSATQSSSPAGSSIDTMLCRAEATAATQQLQAAQAEAGDLSVFRSRLQHELAAVEAQRKHSQAELAQAEQRVQQLQVLTTVAQPNSPFFPKSAKQAECAACFPCSTSVNQHLL